MESHEIVAAVLALLGAIGVGTWGSSLILRRQYRAAVRQLNAGARSDEATAGKTEAELTSLLQGTAAESVKWAGEQLNGARDDLRSAREDNRLATERIRSLEGRVERLEKDREMQRELLGEHAAWDFNVVEMLRAAGVDVATITPAPPLLLPHH